MTFKFFLYPKELEEGGRGSELRGQLSFFGHPPYCMNNENVKKFMKMLVSSLLPRLKAIINKQTKTANSPRNITQMNVCSLITKSTEFGNLCIDNAST